VMRMRDPAFEGMIDGVFDLQDQVAASVVAAQQQEAVLKRLEVPGAAFDLVLGMPKSPPRPFYDLSESPDALVIHLIGGKLVLTLRLGSPVGASHVAGREAKSGVRLAIYMVSKAEKGSPVD
jgi:hypothetical protein